MGKRLVLIDDVLEDINIFRGLLRKWGLVDYEVVANESFLRPLDVSDQARESFVAAVESLVRAEIGDGIEAIILDVWFDLASDNPDSEEPLGYIIGKALRREFPRVPIVLLTIKSDPQRIIEALHFNFDGFISKGDFRSWRQSTEFEAELYRARRKREVVLEEFRLLNEADLAVVGAEVREPVILHISDIHYDFGPDARGTYDGMLMPLVRDIRENYERESIPLPNLVVVSGDLTHKGAVRGYERAHSFLQSLCVELGVMPEHVVIVPGNHDVSHEISRLSFGEGVDGVVAEPNEFYRFRFSPFKLFFDEFYEGGRVYRLADNKMFTIFDFRDDFRMIVVGFNSCEALDHAERQRGFISMDTVQSALGEFRGRFGAGSGFLKVAVWHHPFLYKDPGDPAFNDEVLGELARAGFELCLHGHIHKPYDRITPRRHGDNGVFQFGAGTIAASPIERPPNWPRHYEVIGFDLAEGRAEVHSRHRVGDRWLPLSSFPENRARFDFPLKSLGGRG